MKTLNYYKVLGVSSKASIDEIKQAYRKLVKKFHPDKNDGDKFFEEYFKQIQEAYETLSDVQKRKVYDDELFGRKNYKDETSDKYSREREIIVSILIDEKEIVRNRPFSITYKINHDALKLELSKFDGLKIVSEINKKEGLGVSYFIFTAIAISSGKLIIPESKIILKNNRFIITPTKEIIIAEEKTNKKVKRKFNVRVLVILFLLIVGCVGYLVFRSTKSKQLKVNSIAYKNEPIAKETRRTIFISAEDNYYEGKEFLKIHMYDEAINYLSKAIDINPKFKDAYIDRAMCKTKLNDYDGAISDYTKAIALTSVDSAYKLYVYRANAKRKNGNVSGALFDYNTAVTINPNDKWMWYEIGYYKYYDLGQYSEAIYDFKKAIEIDSTIASFYHIKALCYYYLKEYKKSINDLSLAIQLEPKNSQYFYDRGDVFDGLNLLKNACLDWNKAYELGYAVPEYKLTNCKDRFSSKTGDSPFEYYFGLNNFDKNSFNKVEINGCSDLDAVFCLVDNHDGRTILNKYIRANENLLIENIPDGKYYIKVLFGKNWNAFKSANSHQVRGCFEKNIIVALYKDEKDKLLFKQKSNSKRIEYVSYELDLNILLKKPTLLNSSESMFEFFKKPFVLNLKRKNFSSSQTK